MIFAMLKSLLKPKKGSKNKNKTNSKTKTQTPQSQKSAKNKNWWNSFFKEVKKIPKDLKKIQKQVGSSVPKQINLPKLSTNSKPVQKNQKPYRTQVKIKIEKQWEKDLKKLENKKSLTNTDVKRKNFLLERLGKKETPAKSAWWKLFFGERKQSLQPEQAMHKKQSPIIISVKDDVFELSLESIIEKTINEIPNSFHQAKLNSYKPTEIQKREQNLVKKISSEIRKKLPAKNLKLFAGFNFPKVQESKIITKIVEKPVKVNEKVSTKSKTLTASGKSLKFSTGMGKDEQVEALEDRMKTLLEEAQSEGDEVKADNIVRVFDKLLNMVETKQSYAPPSISQEVSSAYTGKKAKQKKKSVIREITKTRLETELDRVYDVIKQRGKTRLNSLARELEMPAKKTEEYIRVLQQTGLVTFKYPPIGEPVVEIISKKGGQ